MVIFAWLCLRMVTVVVESHDYFRKVLWVRMVAVFDKLHEFLPLGCSHDYCFLRAA